MIIEVRIKKKGKLYLASCDSFNLYSEAHSEIGAAKKIVEAFEFAMQNPDFVEAYHEKLECFFQSKQNVIASQHVQIDIGKFFKNVMSNASFTSVVSARTY